MWVGHGLVSLNDFWWAVETFEAIKAHDASLISRSDVFCLCSVCLVESFASPTLRHSLRNAFEWLQVLCPKFIPSLWMKRNSNFRMMKRKHSSRAGERVRRWTSSATSNTFFSSLRTKIFFSLYPFSTKFSLIHSR